MVDAVGVEIFRHLAETVFPPCKTVLCHFVPIVGRESPVLSEHREVVWWSSGLAVHVEESGILPCVHALASDADRYVSLQHYAVLMRIVAHLAQLAVEMILCEVVEAEFILMLLDEAVYLFFVVDCIFSPAGVVGGVEEISQYTPGGV